MTLKDYLVLKNKSFEELSPEEKNQIKEYNKNLITEYPFLVPYNIFSGIISEDYDFTYTWMDNVPDGWRIAFGKQLLDDLKAELLSCPYKPKNEYNDPPLYENDTWLNHYRINQIKQKNGCLHWYDNEAPGNVYEILSKYSELSIKTCIKCGDTAEFLSKGWVSPYCKGCANVFYKKGIESYCHTGLSEQEANQKFPFCNTFEEIEQ